VSRAEWLTDPIRRDALCAFGASGTPMGVLIDAGTIASPVATGAGAVLDLISTATVSPQVSGGRR
jgi:hypothetical protein